jgi:hypothetical protein
MVMGNLSWNFHSIQASFHLRRGNRCSSSSGISSNKPLRKNSLKIPSCFCAAASHHFFEIILAGSTGWTAPVGW